MDLRRSVQASRSLLRVRYIGRFQVYPMRKRAARQQLCRLSRLRRRHANPFCCWVQFLSCFERRLHRSERSDAKPTVQGRATIAKLVTSLFGTRVATNKNKAHDTHDHRVRSDGTVHIRAGPGWTRFKVFLQGGCFGNSAE